MSEIRRWVRHNLDDARQLIGSGVHGAQSAVDPTAFRPALGESARTSWKAGVVGATIGVIAGIVIDERKPSRGAILGGLAGAAFGVAAELAWDIRPFVASAAHGAAERMSATRNSQWLRRHPINYA